MSWTSKPKRNGNDEMPTDRVAVKIIRPSRPVESPRSPRLSHSPIKQPVTKVARLVYEPKRDPTPAVVKSIHSYKIHPARDAPVEDPKRQPPASTEKKQTRGLRNKWRNREILRNDNHRQSTSKQVIASPEFQTRCAQKRLELQKEIGQIQDILRGLADERPALEPSDLANRKHSNVRARVDIPNPAPKNTTGNATIRSKTDPFLPGRGRFKGDPLTPSSNADTERKQSARSKSSINVRSSHSDTIAMSTAKKRSYDPERARQYMEEQKERRKATAEAAKQASLKVNPVEIKKRLENLRKNTLAILQKNVKKARKVSVDSNVTLFKGGEQAEQHLELEKNPYDLPSTPRWAFDQLNSPNANAYLVPNHNSKRIEKETYRMSASKKTQPLQPSHSNIAAEPLEYPKKIGLLRKPETDLDNLPNLINTLEPEPDKENIPAVPADVEQNDRKSPPSLPAVQENAQINAEPAALELEEKLPDLELNIPDVTLKYKSCTAVAEKSTQAEPPLPQKSTLPYWLQPTPVQLYPYNFIKAVRKKLEAITNPVLSTKDQQTETDIAAGFTTALDRTQKCIGAGSLSLPAVARRRLLSRRGLNEVSSINMEQISGHKLSTASSVFTPFLDSPALASKKPKSPSLADSVQPPEVPPPPAQEHSKSLSEITSSVTLNVPASHTVSEISSIHSEVAKQPLLSSTRVSKQSIKKRQKNDEDTTASSSVFSSPEKRLIASKRPEQVNTQEICANFDVNPADNNGHDDKLKTLSPLSVDKISNLTLKSKSSGTSQAEVKTREDFEKMLQDFNKSLSHVIEANEKLQCALSKSPPPSSPKSIAEDIKPSESLRKTQIHSKSASLDGDAYSSDFEKSTSKKTLSSEKSSDVARLESRAVEIPRLEEIKSSSTSINTGSKRKTSVERKTPSNSSLQKENSQASPLPTDTVDDSVKNKSNSISDFPDSIEEASRTYMKIILSPNPQHELQDSNNFSKDSLELYKETVVESNERIKAASREAIIRNQINVSRGDRNVADQKHGDVLASTQTGTAFIRISDEAISQRSVLNSSMGSDICAIFNQTEMELSIISENSRLSESQLNYSTLGLYEQLIRTEAIKTEHLSALLKIREKSILDRTRGQIALLEIQKEKCKAKGLPTQISVIKRKQRAILMKMEKERDEIKRILKLSEKNSDHSKQKSSDLRVPKIPELPASLDLSFRRNLKQLGESRHDTRAIVRGYELDANSTQNLETLLQDREKELRRRREHVERLLQWHQRLDQEEEEVLRIEQMLYCYNQQKRIEQTTSHTPPIEDGRKQKKLMEIGKSLRELQSITRVSESEVGTGKKPSSEYVQTSGRKLNKLWHRLTGRKELRFEQVKKYKLQKCDLENLYEDAKAAVLADFQENDNMGILTDPSKCNDSTNSLPGLNSMPPTKETFIPNLNLNFSSDASELDNSPSQKMVDNGILSKTLTENEDENTTSAAEVSLGKSADENFKTSDSDYTTKFTSSQSSSTGMICAADLAIDSNKCVPAKKNERSYAGTTQTMISEENGMLKIATNEQLIDNVGRTFSPVDTSLIEKNEQVTEADAFQLDSASIIKPDSHDFEFAIQAASPVPIVSDKTFTSENREDNPFSFCEDASSSHNESFSMVADISAPKFESTVEDAVAGELASEVLDIEAQLETNTDSNVTIDREKSFAEDNENHEEQSPSKLEKRLNDLEQSLIELNNSFERVLSPEVNTFSAHITVDVETNEVSVDGEKDNDAADASSTKITVKDFLLNPEATSNLMPDIINEVELRRRQQILAESDIIQLENAVPYALLREIPNKPPPPYVPPAHGSPMTTIFPTECRIKEITFRRTSELYEGVVEKENSTSLQASILDENITNIYERIILDICRECIRDYQPTFSASLVIVGNYKMPLALYNPPNRLKCIQEFVYKRVRKLLNMDKRQARSNSIFSLGRRKRDHVDEILIQELYEEEHKWTNFDLEEEEVKQAVIDEVFQELVKEIIDDFEESYQSKGTSKSSNEKLGACETGACSAESIVSSDKDVCRE